MKENEIKNLLYSFFSRQTGDAYKLLNAKYDLSAKFQKLKIKEGYDYETKLLKFKELSGDSDIVLNDLSELYKNNIKYGSKFIRFYKLNPDSINALSSRIKTIEKENHIIIENYPYLISLEEKERVATEKIYFCEKTTSENEISLIYTSIVEYSERQAIPIEDIQNSNEFKKYNEIYGVIKKKDQFFNIVNLNTRTGILEIRVDYLNTMSDTVIKNNYYSFITSFLSKLDLPIDFLKLKNFNIYNSIKELYKNEKQGILVELSFLTKTAINVQLKRRKYKTDIREEEYHVAGENAIKGLIDIYRVAFIWQNKDTYYNELLIPGNSGTINSVDINEVILKNCIFSEDFYFLKGKIFEYLQK